jgi:hypothetical protein
MQSRTLFRSRIFWLSEREVNVKLIAEDHVNEVAARLGRAGVAMRGHHCTILPYAPDVKFQIVFTNTGDFGCLETVWTFDAPRDKARMNQRRGQRCKSILDAASPPRCVQLIILPNDSRVGFAFDLPAEPDAAFYDAVAEGAKWVQSHVKPSELDRVK